MNRVVDILEAERKSLVEDRQQHTDAIRRIDDRIEYLATLQEKLQDTSPPPPFPACNGTMKAETGVIRLKPGAAIISYLKIHPGSPANDIVVAVAGRIKTKSKQPERLLRASIRQMVMKGKLKQDTSKGLRVATK